jgi:hypothetical protein
MDPRVEALKNKEKYPKEEEDKAHMKVVVYYSLFIAVLLYVTFFLKF